ncbi:MAG: energy transducer TonB [Verrucomicrobia bacterium]|nr:energy transducer TonB [Verrucomicrobiota bacterium]
MRNVINVVVVFGCIAVAQAEDGSSTNTDRPRSIHAARVIKQSWMRPDQNWGTNAVILGTNALTLLPSLDIKERQFGPYYKALMKAVEERWIGLLEQRDYLPQKAGSVVLEFKLHRDGRVTDMKVVDSTVNEVLCLICQKSVVDPCPFARWPNEMQQSIGSEQCTLTLTFKYPPDGGSTPHNRLQ